LRASSALPEEKPLAVIAKIKNALRVVAADWIGERRGIRLGQSLADARGIVPDLCVVEADEAADQALLEAVADWCDRYTPLVALDPPLGLFLDISGCAHLFAEARDERNGGDGEAALLSDCLGRLSSQGFEAYGAIASTAGAAWALARYGEGGCVPAGSEAEAIAALPVAALRVGAEEEALLDRLGLKRIGQLLGKPRAPLTARFGADLIRRLDQALGIEDEVLSPRRPAPRLSAERRFAEPVVDQDSLLETVRSLARTLHPALERHGIGARLLETSFYRTDGDVTRAAVRTANPVRAPESVGMLFAERFSALGSDFDAGFGFDMVRLSVLQAEPLAAAQIDLAGEGTDAADFDSLVDQLGVRLGASRITRFLPVDTHVPERASQAKPLAASAAAAPAWTSAEGEAETPPDRPLRLFTHPEAVQVVAEVPEGPPLRFRWRRVVHEVARAEGPERIAPEWWRPEDTERNTRDYFRVEDAEGRRYWLFREGLYGRETGSPAWYVHGLFG
jgi:protein ImuB